MGGQFSLSRAEYYTLIYLLGGFGYLLRRYFEFMAASSHSDGNVIQIVLDRRFSGLLLILLDFIIVYIVIALAG